MGVTRYVALLRGINVGGNKKVDMRALKQLFVSLGYADAVTYINSGNVVFSAGGGKPAAIVAGIEARLAADVGVPARVLLRTGEQLSRVVERHPFAAPGIEGNRLYVTFLAAQPAAARVKALVIPGGETASFEVEGSEVYHYYPDGYGRTRLALPFFERGLGVVGTSRNLNTVSKLAALAAPDRVDVHLGRLERHPDGLVAAQLKLGDRARGHLGHDAELARPPEPRTRSATASRLVTRPCHTLRGVPCGRCW